MRIRQRLKAWLAMFPARHRLPTKPETTEALEAAREDLNRAAEEHRDAIRRIIAQDQTARDMMHRGR